MQNNNKGSNKSKFRKAASERPKYVYCENFEPVLMQGEQGLTYTYIPDDSDTFKAALKIGGIADPRNRMLSVHNISDNLDFLFNYAEYTALLANHAGDETMFPKSYKNRRLAKLKSYGYVPIIMVPVQVYNNYVPALLQRLNVLKLNYIPVPTASFAYGGVYDTKDYWVHRMDLAKLMNCAPEDVRMSDAIREVFRID